MPVILGNASRPSFDAADAMLRNKAIESQERIAKKQIAAANARAAIGAAQSALGMLNSNAQQDKALQAQAARDAAIRAENARIQQQNSRITGANKVAQDITREDEKWRQFKDQWKQRGFKFSDKQEALLDQIDDDLNRLKKQYNDAVRKDDKLVADRILFEILQRSHDRWIHQPETPIPPIWEKDADGREFRIGNNGQPYYKDEHPSAQERIQKENAEHALKVQALLQKIRDQADSRWDSLMKSGALTDAEKWNATADQLAEQTTADLISAGADPGTRYDPSMKIRQLPGWKPGVGEGAMTPAQQQSWVKWLADKQEAMKKTIADELFDQATAKPASQEKINEEFNKRWPSSAYGQLEQKYSPSAGASPQQQTQAEPGLPAEVQRASEWLQNYSEKVRSGFRFNDPKAVLQFKSQAEAVLNNYRSQHPEAFAPSARATQQQPSAPAQPAQQPVDKQAPIDEPRGPYKGRVLGKQTSAITDRFNGAMDMTRKALSQLSRPIGSARSQGMTNTGTQRPLDRTERAVPGLGIPQSIGERQYAQQRREWLEQNPEPKQYLSGTERLRDSFTRPFAATPNAERPRELYPNKGETSRDFPNDIFSDEWKSWDAKRTKAFQNYWDEAVATDERVDALRAKNELLGNAQSMSTAPGSGRTQSVGVSLSPFAFVKEMDLRSKALDRFNELRKSAAVDVSPAEPGRVGQGEGGTSEKSQSQINAEYDAWFKKMISPKTTWDQFKEALSETANRYTAIPGPLQQQMRNLSFQADRLGDWGYRQPEWSRPDNLSEGGWDNLQERLGKTGEFDSESALGQFLAPHYDKPGASMYGPTFSKKSGGLSNDNTIKVEEDRNGNLKATNAAGETSELPHRDFSGVVTLYGKSPTGAMPDNVKQDSDQAASLTAQANQSVSELANDGFLPTDAEWKFDDAPNWVTKFPAASWTGKDGKEHQRSGIGGTVNDIVKLFDDASKDMELGKYAPENRPADQAAEAKPQEDVEPETKPRPLPAELGIGHKQALTPEMQEYHLKTPRPPSRKEFEEGLRANGFNPQPDEYQEFIDAREAVRSQLPRSATQTAPGNLFIDKDGKLKMSDGRKGDEIKDDTPLPPTYKNLVPQARQQQSLNQPQQRPQPRAVGPEQLRQGVKAANAKMADEARRSPFQQQLDRMAQQQADEAKNFGQPRPLPPNIGPQRPAQGNQPMPQNDPRRNAADQRLRMEQQRLDDLRKQAEEMRDGINDRVKQIQNNRVFEFPPDVSQNRFQPTFQDFSSMPPLSIGNRQPDYENMVASPGFSPSFMPSQQPDYRQFLPTYSPPSQYDSYQPSVPEYYNSPAFQPQFDNFSFQPQYEPVGYEIPIAPYIEPYIGTNSFLPAGNYGDYFYGNGDYGNLGDYSSYV